MKITEYCDEAKLSTRARLDLFIEVCQAIQHAHQKGIIHRDIKPSNILVTQHDDVAVPKVIDFGIAKATTGQLTDKTLFTAFAQFIGTPAYMSPEQAQMSGLDVDTRADIYSLGVLLYELLTGNTPFDAKELLAAGLDEMRRKIREDEPTRPSICLSTMQAMALTTVAKQRHAEPPKLIHLIRGDLDWLVMKCLEKDRTRRYETASALAMDLQRHLNSEPVVARSPSPSYRFQKFVRRNKLAFAAAATVAAALVVGLGLSTWLFLRERAALKVAHENALWAEDSRRQAEVNAKKAGAEALKSRQVSQFLDDTLRGVGPWIAKGRDTTILRELLEKAAERVGHLTNEPEVELELRNTIGRAFGEIRQNEKARAVLGVTPELARKLWGDDSLQLADSLQNLALVRDNLSKVSETEPMLREVVRLRKKLLPKDDPAIATAIHGLANNLHSQGRHAEAETMQREALALRRKLVGIDDGGLASSIGLLAMMLRDQGRLAEAEPLYREALAINRKVANGESPAVAQVLVSLAGVVRRRGKLAEAETIYRETLPMCKKFFGEESPEVGYALNGFAAIFERQGKAPEAETLLRELLATQREKSGDEHPALARSLFRLANTLSDQGKYAEAEAVRRELVVLRRKLSADDPQLAADLSGLAVALLAQKKFTEAEPVARESLSIREANVPDAWQTFDTRCIAGASLLGQKQYAEAEQLLLSGYQGMKQRKDKLTNNGKVRLRENLQLLVQLYEAKGQAEKAAEWNRKLAEFDQAETEKKTVLKP